VHDEAEPTPPGLLDQHRRVPLVEATLQQDEPALEAVAEVGQVERRIDSTAVAIAVATTPSAASSAGPKIARRRSSTAITPTSWPAGLP